VPFEIKVDHNLLRPTDEPVIYGDSSKLESLTGWAQTYHLEETIKDMINYWRDHI
jgi:GDP-4-dehydro-6-deoxy-D-mannose reductase